LSRDFALTHTAKKCEIYCLLLSDRQRVDYLPDEESGIAEGDLFLGVAVELEIGLLFRFAL